MNKLNSIPLVRVLAPFAAGIITALLLDREFHIPFWVILLLALVSGFYVFWLSKHISYRTRWIYGIFLFALFFSFGFEITVQRTEKFGDDHYISMKDPRRYTFVRITAPLQEREKSYRAEAEFISCGEAGQWKPCCGKVLLYFSKDSASAVLQYGDIILLGTPVEIVAPPDNPGEFNYRQYLSRRSVYHQAYVAEGKFRFAGKGYRNPLYVAGFNARDEILRILESKNVTGDEFAVTSALLIGYKEKLDQDLVRTYSGTGASHILCVSGMHVAVMFVILNYVLFFMDKLRHGQIPKMIILLLAIWSYALITGFSPSVLRASAMFSLIVIARTFSRDTNIYNSISASALLLLLINPYYITDVGFQLSYLAVLGIVAIYPPVSRIWKPRWWLMKQIWSIVCVSFAAQLATFPLGLYYFHQFPNYFLLTNLIAVPLSGFIMYAGVATLALSFIPYVSEYISQALVWMVYAMNHSLGFIESLPGALSEGLYITLTEMFMIYAIIVLFCVFLILRKPKLLPATIIAALLLLASITFRSYQNNSRHSFVVYRVNKHTACDFVTGKHCVFVADSALLAEQGRESFTLKNNRTKMGIASLRYSERDQDNFEEHHHAAWKKGRFMQFCGRRFAFVSKREAGTRKISTDYLIISGNPGITIRELTESYDTKMIIIDSSNPRYKAARWEEECRSLNIPCHSVPNSGAYAENL